MMRVYVRAIELGYVMAIKDLHIEGALCEDMDELHERCVAEVQDVAAYAPPSNLKVNQRAQKELELWSTMSKLGVQFNGQDSHRH